MMSTATTLRALLLIDILAMAALAIFYLRQRRLSWFEYCCWGMLAILVPLLGPFLVIISCPGIWRDPSNAALPPRLLRTRAFALLGPRGSRKRIDRVRRINRM